MYWYEIAEHIKRQLIQKETILDEKKKLLEVKSKQYQSCFDNVRVLTQAKEVLNKASEISRLKAIEVMENTVNPMLKGIAGDKYTFKVEIGVARGKPSVDFWIVTDVEGAISKQDPIKYNGGGFVDLISTALRYAYISLYDGGINNAMLLDEPARMVSTSSSEDYANFVKYFGEMFHKQTIMCTHNETMAGFADRTIEVSKPKDFSEIKIT